jgi:N-formylmaleamate deformylase
VTCAVRGGQVNANGIRQHYLRYGGDKPPLVVIPGITSPAVTWGFVAERLAEHFTVYVVDARGRGLSESGAHLGHSLDAYADDVVGLVAALGLQGGAFLGHSMGARILIRAAARRGLAPGQLILADPPVTGPGRRPYPTPLAWYVDSIRLAQAGIDGEALRPFSPTWTDEQRQLRAQWLHTCDEAAVVASYDSFHSDDIHADIGLITAPTLLLAAGKGGVIQPEDIAELQRLAPSLRVQTIPDAGHMIPWDDLSGFLDAVFAFLPNTQHAAGTAHRSIQQVQT